MFLTIASCGIRFCFLPFFSVSKLLHLTQKRKRLVCAFVGQVDRTHMRDYDFCFMFYSFVLYG